MRRSLACLALLSAAASAQPRPGGPTLGAVVDADFSAEAGARTLLAARAGLLAGEDRLLPLRWSAEATAGGKALGVGYRLARMALVDVPLDRVVGLVQHEVFGHGARTREFGWTETGYLVDAPWPYGSGSGVAAYEAPSVTPDARGAFSTQGAHASTVLADAVLGDAVQRGRLTYRDAALYAGAATDAALYVLTTTAEGGTIDATNDAVAWRATLNARAARLGLDDRVTLGETHRPARLAALDPMLYLGLYAVAKGYLFDGAPDVALPMLRVGGAGYLPALRFDWGPHGGELLLDHRLAWNGRTALVRMRRASPSVQTAWGAGAAVTGLAEVGGVALDGSVDVWRQPALFLDPDAPDRATGGGLGGAVRATAHLPIPGATGGTGLVVQLGVKTGGFVGADPLAAGPILRVGLSRRLANTPAADLPSRRVRR